jgi:uncharacterized membrane protein YfcA
MDVAGAVVPIPSALVLGVVVGFLAGMFGIGGGILLTPLLSVVFGVPMPIAVGTGLCQMVGTSTVAALRHRRLGNGEPRFAVLLIAGSLIGVSTGARVVDALASYGEISLLGGSVTASTAGLYGAYLLFLGGTAAMMWRQAHTGFDELDFVRRGWLARIRLPPFVDLPAIPLPRVSALVIAYVGLFVGFFSGLLGIGGGIVLIPIILYGFGFPFHHASGTGVTVTLLMGVVGTLVHSLAGHVHLGLAMLLLVGSGISAQLGAIATSRLSARTLRKGLVALIALTMTMIVWDLRRKWEPSPTSSATHRDAHQETETNESRHDA